MSNANGDGENARELAPSVPTGSAMDPAAVQPGTKADPSTGLPWGEHVKKYFNQDVTPGEALPMATDEAKE